MCTGGKKKKALANPHPAKKKNRQNSTSSTSSTTDQPKETEVTEETMRTPKLRRVRQKEQEKDNLKSLSDELWYHGFINDDDVQYILMQPAIKDGWLSIVISFAMYLITII